MELVNTNKSKLIKIVLLSCAGLSLIVALPIVFTNNKSGRNDRSTFFVSENQNLLKSSPNGARRSLESGDGDLTILGHGNNLKATLEEESNEKRENEESRKHPVIHIPRQGRVRGTVLKSRENRDYFAFYQVPYAQPPVGKLRFALPEEPKGWRGIRDASVPGPECLQREKYATEPNITAGKEDCLNINIYTPKLPSRNGTGDELKLPVMFYIHGGGPFGNGTRYGAKYMMDEDIVLVTVEFRLGVFGGFITGSKEFPGNLGNRDQLMALKWIQKNIHRFGGDKKNVVIFGNSSGGGMIQSHLLSPMSKGLFHRAIMQSGTCINNALVNSDPVRAMPYFIKEVGCGDLNTTLDAPETLECLRALDGRTIALSIGQLVISGFQPEKHEDVDENKFLPELPFALLKQGRVENQVPLIVGVVSREMFHNTGPISKMLQDENSTAILNDEFLDMIPGIVHIKDDANHTVAEKFREVYFGSEEVSNKTLPQLGDLYSDVMVHGSRISGMAHANITRQPVYFYWISKEPAYSYGQAAKEFFPPPTGVAHADELQYLFLYDGYPEYPVGSPWFEYSKKLVQIWTSFAREGKPVVKNLPGNKENVDWTPIRREDNGMEWLEIGDEIRYIKPFTERMQLWDQYTDVLYS